MEAMTITLATPAAFRFRQTVCSHGWCLLPPFSYDDRERVLRRVEKLATGRAVRLCISSTDDKTSVQVLAEPDSGPLRRADCRAIEQLVRVCLNIEQDIGPFYKAIRGMPRYRWVARAGAGRLLLSPTVWEDLAKTLLTTNIQWSGTLQMCRRLTALGERLADGENCFPTAAQVAALPLKELSGHIRAGYRAPCLHEMATRIAEGQLAVENWRGAEIPAADLYRALRGIKGFGDYAAGHMLRLLGRYDRLAIDTACRFAFRKQAGAGADASDAAIQRHYEPFGPWRGMAQWMDVLRAYQS